jgi:endonuclease III
MPKAGAVPPIATIIETLRSLHGPPDPPAITDLFQQILLEQVAYLAADAKRLAAFKVLESRVGLRPDDILAAPEDLLLEATTAGGTIAAPLRASRMRESARMVLERWNGDLDGVLSLPPSEAARALAKFPMIGKPGADRILSIAGVMNRFAVDSNGLRVLLRVGYGREDANYDRAYRSVIDEIERRPAMNAPAAVEAYQLLREHGRLTCRRTRPACPKCPLRSRCAFGLQ